MPQGVTKPEIRVTLITDEISTKILYSLFPRASAYDRFKGELLDSFVPRRRTFEIQNGGYPQTESFHSFGRFAHSVTRNIPLHLAYIRLGYSVDVISERNVLSTSGLLASILNFERGLVSSNVDNHLNNVFSSLLIVRKNITSKRQPCFSVGALSVRWCAWALNCDRRWLILPSRVLPEPVFVDCCQSSRVKIQPHNHTHSTANVVVGRGARTAS